MSDKGLSIGFFGAGAIGAYLGIKLSALGLPVTLVGRQSLLEVADQLEAHSIQGASHRPGDDLVVTIDPAALSGVDVCFITVKTRHSPEAGALLKPILSPEAVVCSLQNGLRNPQLLKEAGLDGVLAGMVGFNVFREGGRFVQATSGPMTLDAGAEHHRDRLLSLQSAFKQVGEALDLRSDIAAIQAGKLLINLNNAICTLAGLSIRDSLRSRDLRRAFAASIREGERILSIAGIPTARIGKLSPSLISRLLPLPDAVVLRAAPSLIDIDPRARSSTLQDLEAGKPTEIDALNGELVRIAEEHGASAPVHTWIVAEIRALEAAGTPPPFLTPEAIWQAIKARKG